MVDSRHTRAGGGYRTRLDTAIRRLLDCVEQAVARERQIETGTGGVAVANAIAETVYGELIDSAANQAAPPGSYNDTITVTVTY